MKDDIKELIYLAEECGMAFAQNNLGWYYYIGEQVPQDFKKAFYWTQKAAEQDYIYAFETLAMMYWNGEGTDINFEKAMRWLKRGAMRGNPGMLRVLEQILVSRIQRVEGKIVLVDEDAEWKYNYDTIHESQQCIWTEWPKYEQNGKKEIEDNRSKKSEYVLRRKVVPDNCDEYFFTKKGIFRRFVLTPSGNFLATKNLTLAQRILSDLEKYGEDPSELKSILSFHYSFCDFFTIISREQLEQNVSIGFERENDWTLICPYSEPQMLMRWMDFFGVGSEQSEKGKLWIKTLSLEQLSAVCVFGRAIESVNIPYLIATELPEDHIKDYAKIITEVYPYVETDRLIKFIENFLFYFNLEKKICYERL